VTGEVVDGYCHCGQRKYLPIERVDRIMKRHGVSRAVLVQHLGEYDNSYITDIVRQEPARFAGAFLVDPDGEKVAEELQRWGEGPTFRGVRMPVSTFATRPMIWHQAAELRLNLIVYVDAALAPLAQSLDEFARAHPQSPIVISHLGILDRESAADSKDCGTILALAARPNIFLLVSGMHMFAPPDYAQLESRIRKLSAAFGRHRILYGSNFPVMEEESVYAREIELIATGRLGIPVEWRVAVLAENARRLWFDEPGPSVEPASR
jgi:L-fuconolactonase